MSDIVSDLVERLDEEKRRFKVVSEEYQSESLEHRRIVSEIEASIHERMQESHPLKAGDYVRFSYRFNENIKTDHASNLRLGIGVVASTCLHKRFDYNIQRDVYHHAVVVNLLRVSDAGMSHGIVKQMGIDYHGVVRISEEEFRQRQADLQEEIGSR